MHAIPPAARAGFPVALIASKRGVMLPWRRGRKAVKTAREICSVLCYRSCIRYVTRGRAICALRAVAAQSWQARITPPLQHTSRVASSGALYSRRRRTIASSPLPQDMCKAVEPPAAAAAGSAPRQSSSRATRSLEHVAAHRRGVSPFAASFVSIGAPCSRRRLAHSTTPSSLLMAATCRGVYPAAT